MTPTHLQILRLINAGGPTPRAALMAATGLSKAAMSGLTRDLIDRGLLRETSMVQRQGRPSALLGLNPDGAAFIGVSMMSDPAPVALVDLAGGHLARIDIPRDADPAVFARAVDGAITSLEKQSGIGRDRITGIGVALSGLVDPAQENVIRSTLLGLRDVPLAALIREATGLPTVIENDAKALAVSEKLFGAARDMQSFTLIWLGGGIGAAHFVHGALYRGAHGGAGEIAHVTVDPDGLPCRCGKTGCLDTVASMTAIREAARAEGIPIHRLQELEEHAARGNAAAIRILHRAGAALGLAIAQVIQINDPEMVLVTHREAAFQGLFATVMQQVIEANVLPSLAGVTPLRLQRLTDKEWVTSAASVVTHRFMNGTIAKAG